MTLKTCKHGLYIVEAFLKYMKNESDYHIFKSILQHHYDHSYLTNALLPLLGTLTCCSKYVGHLLVIELLRVHLPFYNLACLQPICTKHSTN